MNVWVLHLGGKVNEICERDVERNKSEAFSNSLTLFPHQFRSAPPFRFAQKV